MGPGRQGAWHGELTINGREKGQGQKGHKGQQGGFGEENGRNTDRGGGIFLWLVIIIISSFRGKL